MNFEVIDLPIHGDTNLLKEKIIKTDTLLKKYQENLTKLKRAAQLCKCMKKKYEDTKQSLESTLLENDRVNFKLETIQSKYQDADVEMKRLSRDLSELEDKYKQYTFEAQSTIQNLQHELRLLQDLKKSSSDSSDGSKLKCLESKLKKLQQAEKNYKAKIDKLNVQQSEIREEHQEEKSRLLKQIEKLTLQVHPEHDKFNLSPDSSNYTDPVNQIDHVNTQLDHDTHNGKESHSGSEMDTKLSNALKDLEIANIENVALKQQINMKTREIAVLKFKNAEKAVKTVSAFIQTESFINRDRDISYPKIDNYLPDLTFESDSECAAPQQLFKGLNHDNNEPLPKQNNLPMMSSKTCEISTQTESSEVKISTPEKQLVVESVSVQTDSFINSEDACNTYSIDYFPDSSSESDPEDIGRNLEENLYKVSSSASGDKDETLPKASECLDDTQNLSTEKYYDTSIQNKDFDIISSRVNPVMVVMSTQTGIETISFATQTECNSISFSTQTETKTISFSSQTEFNCISTTTQTDGDSTTRDSIEDDTKMSDVGSLSDILAEMIDIPRLLSPIQDIVENIPEDKKIVEKNINKRRLKRRIIWAKRSLSPKYIPWKRKMIMRYPKSDITQDSVTKALQILKRANINFTISNESILPQYRHYCNQDQVVVSKNTENCFTEKLACCSASCRTNSSHMLLSNRGDSTELLGFFNAESETTKCTNVGLTRNTKYPKTNLLGFLNVKNAKGANIDMAKENKPDLVGETAKIVISKLKKEFNLIPKKKRRRDLSSSDSEMLEFGRDIQRPNKKMKWLQDLKHRRRIPREDTTTSGFESRETSTPVSQYSTMDKEKSGFKFNENTSFEVLSSNLESPISLSSTNNSLEISCNLSVSNVQPEPNISEDKYKVDEINSKNTITSIENTNSSKKKQPRDKLKSKTRKQFEEKMSMSGTTFKEFSPNSKNLEAFISPVSSTDNSSELSGNLALSENPELNIFETVEKKREFKSPDVDKIHAKETVTSTEKTKSKQNKQPMVKLKSKPLGQCKEKLLMSETSFEEFSSNLKNLETPISPLSSTNSSLNSSGNSALSLSNEHPASNISKTVEEKRDFKSPEDMYDLDETEVKKTIISIEKAKSKKKKQPMGKLKSRTLRQFKEKRLMYQTEPPKIVSVCNGTVEKKINTEKSRNKKAISNKTAKRKSSNGLMEAKLDISKQVEKTRIISNEETEKSRRAVEEKQVNVDEKVFVNAPSPQAPLKTSDSENQVKDNDNFKPDTVVDDLEMTSDTSIDDKIVILKPKKSKRKCKRKNAATPVRDNILSVSSDEEINSTCNLMPNPHNTRSMSKASSISDEEPTSNTKMDTIQTSLDSVDSQLKLLKAIESKQDNGDAKPDSIGHGIEKLTNTNSTLDESDGDRQTDTDSSDQEVDATPKGERLIQKDSQETEIIHLGRESSTATTETSMEHFDTDLDKKHDLTITEDKMDSGVESLKSKDSHEVSFCDYIDTPASPEPHSEYEDCDMKIIPLDRMECINSQDDSADKKAFQEKSQIGNRIRKSNRKKKINVVQNIVIKSADKIDKEENEDDVEKFEPCDILSKILNDMNKSKNSLKKQQTPKDFVIRSGSTNKLDDKEWRNMILDVAELVYCDEGITSFDPGNFEIQPLPQTYLKNLSLLEKADTIIKKLKLTNEDEGIRDEFVLEFSRFPPETVVNIILYCLTQDEDKTLGKYHPLLMLTKMEWTFLKLMLKLEQGKMKNIFEVYFKIVENQLYRKCAHIIVATITRLYVAICKLYGHVYRVRKLICETFYYSEDLAVILLFTVLSSWIEIFPMKDDVKCLPVAPVMVQLIHLKEIKNPHYKLEPLKVLLNQHYGYPRERLNCDEFFDGLVQDYLRNPTRMANFAIRLFCKYKNVDWLKKKINEIFKPLVYRIPVENENFKATVIVLLANICQHFRISGTDKYMVELKAWFSSLSEGK
ncbi:unnamed protein product [Acanthoscelides obtectus]|uniref:Uncharacterized protein n=1 Tax=Acanthoscelides obtectus TaxID=200917 RepID=A0A9P0LJN0_ACAOB|nr:unnamed protein product [Acanthoscelides obtectus]CAK1675993.1 hypothetical protein AOBTE_LOCUS30534 [Acanthoscelides obtectus]